MANKKAIEYWFLPRTSLQLWQRAAVWHNPFTILDLLPSIETTVVAYTLHLKACVDALELPVQPVLLAKLDIIYGF
jgi:hypothetical protein